MSTVALSKNEDQAASSKPSSVDQNGSLKLFLKNLSRRSVLSAEEKAALQVLRHLTPSLPRWTQFDTHGVLHYSNYIAKEGTFANLRLKIAAFDLDHTLIMPKLRNIFPKNAQDWQLTNPVIPAILRRLLLHSYRIVIFSNQTGAHLRPPQFIEDFRQKIEAVFKTWWIPVDLFACINPLNGCKKPERGMWDLMHVTISSKDDNLTIDIGQSFFVGDASGDPGTFSDADKKFAQGIGLSFFTLKQFFS